MRCSLLLRAGLQAHGVADASFCCVLREQVVDMPATKVVESIERTIYAVASSIMAGAGTRFPDSNLVSASTLT